MGEMKTGAEMSVVELSRHNATGGLSQVVARLIATVVAWNDARITRRELNSLSDRELADIGVTRGDIERIARGL
ncbi:DUF1127 domain-containing protein [Paracoccus methylovorus]